MAEEEKTEEPTGRKRNKAREEGQVAKSQEVSSVCILMTALAVFTFAAAWMINNLAVVMQEIFQNFATINISEINSFRTFVLSIFRHILLTLGPLLGALMVVGVSANIAQFGLLLTGKPFQPKLSKFNPIKGLKKIVSVNSLVELAKSIAKILIIGGVAYLALMGSLDELPGLMLLNILEIMAVIGWAAFKIVFYVCLVLLILAALDFVWQRHRHEKSLKMTKQEVKDERKNEEGDPKIKSRIRGIQFQRHRERMMEAVPEAAVVITNPTHIAVALKFDAPTMSTPAVIAKGAGVLAERIKTIARQHDIPVIENKTLARALYKMVEVGGIIPIDLYRAVAEVLAYVYRLKNPTR